MDFRLFSLKWAPLLAALVFAAVSSVEAQGSATNTEQSIVFSSPGTNVIPANPMSPSTQAAASSDFRSLFQDTSPVPSFNDFSPGPAPIPREGRRLRTSSGLSQDWEFMTPAEIMGVAPDQNTQSQKPGMNDQQGSLTPMERFLERQNPTAKMKSAASDNVSPSQIFSGTGNDPGNSYSSDLINSGQDNLQPTTIFSQSANAAPYDNLFASPNGESAWSKLLGVPAPAPAPAPNAAQQQAEMDQFMQLLNPGSAPVTATTASQDSLGSSQLQTALLGPDSTQPLVNPIGASFAPLTSGIGQAPSLTPLPTITRQASVQPVAPPAWAPQPAPWMSQTLQPFAIPQRKF
jgi:hypothetical protein